MKERKMAAWKRGLALLLSVVLTVGVLSSGAFAADDDMNLSFIFTDTDYNPTTSAAPGSTVYLGLKVENYIPIISYSMRIRYDAEKLDFYADYNLGSGRDAEFKNGVDIVSILAPRSCNADEDQGYVTITFAADTAASSEDALDKNNVILYLAFKVLEIGTAKVSYDTNNGQGGYLWDIATTGGTQIDVDLQEEIFQGIAPGVILDKKEVQVDGTNNATVQAGAYNTELKNMTNSVTWNVEQQDGVETKDVTVSQTGEVTIAAKAKAGDYTITATATDENTFGERLSTATAKLTVTRAPSVAQSMRISCDASQLTVPTAGEVQKTIPFTATVKDQYDETVSDPVTWSLVGSYPGITMDSETGKLTITSKASACTLQVKAVCGSLDKIDEFEVTKADSVATSAFILKNGNRIYSDVVPIPTGGTSNSVSYTCEILDQFDLPIERAGEHISWSITNSNSDPTTITGVSIENGTLTVTKDAKADTSFVLKAVYNEQTSSAKPEDAVTITLKDIEVTWPEVTLKEDPVYGDTWEQIVTKLSGGSASLNGQKVSGEFTLVSTGRPDAGDQSYTIQFASTDDKYTVTKTETVNLAKRTVTLTWSGNANLTYDGNAKNVTAAVDNLVSGDNCTVTVTGGTETNAGIYTATASLSGTASSNYQLPTTYTCQYTIEKAAVAQPTLQTGLAYNGQFQTVAEVAEDGLYTLTGNKATNAGTYNGTASLKDKTNYKWAIKDNSDDLDFSWTIDRAPYTVSLTKKTVSVKVGTSSTDFLPTAYTEGVNNETPAGTLTFYTDASRKTPVTGEWVSQQSLGDRTLYWSFTTTNSNYVEAAKTGTITMTVIAGDPQYISFENDSKTVTYGDAAFTNTVTVKTTNDASVTDGGAITYQSSDDEVVTVNADGQVTIVGAGTATITATAAAVPGQYAQGTGSYTVTVSPKALTNAMVADVSNETYSGSPIHPEPTVTDGEALVKDVDFTYSYGANTNAGTATVTVTGQGNYQGTINKTFTINKAVYDKDTVAKTVSIVKNRDEAQTGTLTTADFLTEKLEGAIITGVTGSDTHVLSGVPTVKDGVLSYTSGVNLTGTISDDVYTVTITTTNYENITATLTFHATDKQNVSEQITFENGSAVYNGQVQTYEKATFTGTGSGSITYTYSPADVKNAGTYTVTATYEDDTQVGTAQATFVIEKKPLTVTAGTATITKVYDGTTNAGTLTGKLSITGLCAADTATELETGTVPSYSKADVHTENLDVPVSLPESLAKNYTLAQTSVSIPASITAKEITPVVEDVAAVTYNGTAQQPKPAVKDGETALVEGRDFTYSYANNTNAGTATVTVAAKNGGNYTFTSVSKDFAIDKAEYTGTVPSQTVNISQNRDTAQSGTLTLSQLMTNAPAGAAIESVTPGSGTMMQEVKVDGGKISYTSKTNITTNTDEVYQVTVSSTNYEDFQIKLTFHPVAKTAVTVSGVSVADKTYNGKAASYTGTPVAKVDGQTVSVTGYTYTWYDADGDALTGAPKNAGTYSLVIAVTDTDPNYSGAQTVHFEIKKANVTITPKDVQVKQGDDMPELKYTVSGLAGGEALAKTPKLTCNADLDKVGKYPITASGAQVPNTDNYASILYETGILEVTDKDAGETSTVERPDGSVVTTVEREDGTSQVTYERPDGAYSVTEIDKDDCSATQVYLPTEVIEDADGDVITLPMYAVTAAARWSDAPTVTVDLPRNTSVRVEIPVTRVQPGTVAVLVKSNGAQEVIQNTVTTKDGIYVKLSDGDTVKIVNNASSFDDVSGSYWGADAIDYATSRELFDGVGNDKFDPEGQMTRAMIVTVLARYVGVDTSTGDEWYDAGRSWAMRNNVSDGTNMNGSVTREQLVTMLWRYVGEPKGSRITGFVDTAEISSYAEEAMGWAVDLGLIEGMGHDNIDPQGTATRAQVSAILMRFIQATN